MKQRTDPSKPAGSIDEVLEYLDLIIERSSRERNQLGAFAALYRKTTLRIKEGIESGQFDDGQRMAQLDVVFANRYFEAVHQFRQGGQPSRCWLVSFEAGHSDVPSTIRHLVLGMNAHINFDLAIATAEICCRRELPGLKGDFDYINRILTEVFTQIRPEIDESWSGMKLMDKIHRDLGEALIRLCMAEARGRAWRIATRLAALRRADWDPAIHRLDRQVALVAKLISGQYWRRSPETESHG